MSNTLKKVAFPWDWNMVVMGVLGFWLSASLMLDLLVIPVLSATGMMADTGFISAGYVLFGLFNRVELVCAALVLAAFFMFHTQQRFGDRQGLQSLMLASGLLNIALLYTYVVTPQLSGWGIEMESMTTLGTMPIAMVWWHGCYWVLEVLKFSLGLTLWRWCYPKNGVLA